MLNHLNNEVLNITSVHKTEAYRLKYNVNGDNVNGDDVYHRGITPVVVGQSCCRN